MVPKIKNIITKANLKSERCEVAFKERFVEDNYTNEVNKKCDQIIHGDLRDSFLSLRPFLVTITEQPESSLINESNIDQKPDEEMEKELAKYFITGYERKGTEDTASVKIIGQKMLTSGQSIDLVTPYIKFTDSEEKSYQYGSELCEAIERCDWEITEYLFNGKYGFKQQQLDFETDSPEEATVVQEEEKPKTRRTGRKKVNATVPFDPYA